MVKVMVIVIPLLDLADLFIVSPCLLDEGSQA